MGKLVRACSLLRVNPKGESNYDSLKVLQHSQTFSGRDVETYSRCHTINRRDFAERSRNLYYLRHMSNFLDPKNDFFLHFFTPRKISKSQRKTFPPFGKYSFDPNLRRIKIEISMQSAAFTCSENIKKSIVIQRKLKFH
jgi:hypothetical protein